MSHSVLFLPPTKLATRKLLLVYSTTLLKKVARQNPNNVLQALLCAILPCWKMHCSQSELKKIIPAHTKQLQLTARWIQLSCPCFLSSWTGFSVILTLISKQFKELKTKNTFQFSMTDWTDCLSFQLEFINTKSIQAITMHFCI